MQLKYLSLVPLLVLGTILGALLIPREVELGLMSYKANRFPAAEPIYVDRHENGDLSVGIVFPLTQIYLNDGRVDEAIAILEELIAADPGDLEALQLVGKLYGDAQRLDDYTRNLERLNAVAPAQGQLRELINYYDRSGAFDKEITALQSLISTYGGSPRDFHQLAALLADDGKLGDAAVVLQVVAVNQPDWLDPDMRTLLFRLLLDTDATPTATALAIEWVTAGVSREEVQYLASEMLGRGSVDEALAIFAPFMSAAASDPVLQPLLLSLLMASGETAKTVALLADWHTQGQLTAETLAQYVSVALASGAIELAEVLTAGDNLPELSADLLAQIVDDGFGQDAFTVVAQAGHQFVDADLATRPLVGAKVAVADGDLGAAALWADVALRGRDTSVTAAIELAEILILLDDKPAALTLLDGVVKQTGTPAEAYQILARLYVDLDRAEAGFALFSDLRAGAPGDLSSAGWALLASYTGRADLVLDWLAGRPRIHADNLEDIVVAAQATGADELALAGAKQLFALKDGPQERLLLGEALLRLGQAGPALEHLRLIVTALPEAESAFVKALQGVGADDELATFLALKDETTAGGLAQTDLIYDLLVSDGVPVYLLPFVERLARDTGGDWLYTYAELAQRAQQIPRLVSFLETELKRPAIAPAVAEEQLSMLAQVSPDRALRTVEQLAQQAPRQWSKLYFDMLQAAGDTQLLQAAIESGLASGGVSADVEALAFALLDAGDVAASLSAARLLAQEKGGDWLFTYAEIATKAGRQTDLAEFLATEIQRPDLTPADVSQRVDLLVSAAPGEAVAVLQPLVEQDPTRWFVPFFELLQQQGDVDGVTRLIERRLAASDVPAAELEAASYSLVAAPNTDASLPTVRRLAETLGGDWVFTYVDLAQRAQRSGDAINFVNHQLNRQNLKKADFEDLVSLLIAIDPVPAVALLKHRAGADGGLWYEAYTEALLTVPPRERGLASSRRAMEFLASSVGGRWLRAYAEKARADNREVEFVEFLNEQRGRTDLEPANATIIAEMWSAL